MLKKCIAISFTFTIFVMVCIAGRNLHLYYRKHVLEHEQAALYLSSDVCTKFSSKLGDYSKCEQSKHIVRMSPFVLAWYDFLEDMFICGHGRCQRLLNEITSKLPYITIFVGLSFCWTSYQALQVQRAHNAAMFYSLPNALPLRAHYD